MHLTSLEEEMLNGEHGRTLEIAMGILVALGDIYDADGLIPIKSTQIAGVSYKTIGDAGLEWISDMEGTVAVPSILNPAGMDLQCSELMGIGSDSEFATKQRQIVSAYEKLGIKTECTCTPYYLNDSIADIESLANYGDHLAWSESSAISYANSVIGARTNREGGPSALAAALVGKTPNYGYHLDENRVPTMVVKVEGKVSDTDFGALGHIVGKEVGNGIPLFIFEKSQGMVDEGTAPVQDGLKALGAAMAASGAVALYYVQGVTPDSRKSDAELPSDHMDVTLDDMMSVRRVANILNADGVVEEVNGVDLDAGMGMEIDVVAIGCPHCSDAELSRLAHLLSGKAVVMTTWIFTSRHIYNKNPELVSVIEASGAKVICDTCMVVSPGSSGFKRMLVNSGKAYNYVPSMCKIAASYAPMEDCVKVALGEKTYGRK